jgi:hypothetical protein
MPRGALPIYADERNDSVDGVASTRREGCRRVGTVGTPITPLSDAISMPPLLVSGIIGVIGAKDPTKVSSLLL